MSGKHDGDRRDRCGGFGHSLSGGTRRERRHRGSAVPAIASMTFVTFFVVWFVYPMVNRGPFQSEETSVERQRVAYLAGGGRSPPHVIHGVRRQFRCGPKAACWPDRASRSSGSRPCRSEFGGWRSLHPASFVASHPEDGSRAAKEDKSAPGLVILSPFLGV